MNIALVVVYVAAMVSANFLVWWLGPWFSPINGFLLIGLDLTLRDVMQERFNKWQLLGVICTGAVITFAINPSVGWIGFASAFSFLASAMVDWAVYTALRDRPWLVKANGSNVVGAAVDSILFPTIAFGVFLPHIIALQFLAKVSGGAVWSLILQPLLNRRKVA